MSWKARAFDFPFLFSRLEESTSGFCFSCEKAKVLSTMLIVVEGKFFHNFILNFL